MFFFSLMIVWLSKYGCKYMIIPPIGCLVVLLLLFSLKKIIYILLNIMIIAYTLPITNVFYKKKKNNIN